MGTRSEHPGGRRQCRHRVPHVAFASDRCLRKQMIFGTLANSQKQRSCAVFVSSGSQDPDGFCETAGRAPRQPLDAREHESPLKDGYCGRKYPL